MTTRFEQVLAEALQLSPLEQLAIIEQLAASFTMRLSQEQASANESPLSQQELDELMQVEPLSPKEIEALGLLGTWADQEISDGAEWVNEQKRKRKERRKW